MLVELALGLGKGSLVSRNHLDSRVPLPLSHHLRYHFFPLFLPQVVQVLQFLRSFLGEVEGVLGAPVVVRILRLVKIVNGQVKANQRLVEPRHLRLQHLLLLIPSLLLLMENVRQRRGALLGHDRVVGELHGRLQVLQTPDRVRLHHHVPPLVLAYR